MRPTKRHMKVDRYVDPSEFDRWKERAEDMGFLYVASGPLVRSSYKVSIQRFISSLLIVNVHRQASFISRMY
jgi:lipoic acid synthetase